MLTTSNSNFIEKRISTKLHWSRDICNCATKESSAPLSQVTLTQIATFKYVLDLEV